MENLGGWLTTIVARVSLNMLQSRRSRREEPMDPPAIDQVNSGGTNPEQEAVLADSVGLALLVVLALVAGIGWWQLDGRYTKVPGVDGKKIEEKKEVLEF